MRAGVACIAVARANQVAPGGGPGGGWVWMWPLRQGWTVSLPTVIPLREWPTRQAELALTATPAWKAATGSVGRAGGARGHCRG